MLGLNFVFPWIALLGVESSGWTPISNEGAPAPTLDGTVVWTGKECLLFGGRDGNWDERACASAYDPGTDRWRELSQENRPSARAWHSGVWSGREMILWGGDGELGPFSDGAAYDPRSDAWRVIQSVGCPRARGGHVAVWTGSHMLVWAGVDDERSFPDGGLYDPTTDSWTSLTVEVEGRVPRSLPSVWGDGVVLSWGGINGGSVLGHGVVLDPSDGRTTPIPLEGAPSPRAYHSGVWVESGLFIWGGSASLAGGRAFGDGARFDPETRSWSEISRAEGPTPRYAQATVVVGRTVIIAGGSTRADVAFGTAEMPITDALADVWSWNPDSGWTRIPDLPAGRAHGHLVVANDELLLIGGRDARGPVVGGVRLPLDAIR